MLRIPESRLVQKHSWLRINLSQFQ
jgi:hypothetical protein